MVKIRSEINLKVGADSSVPAKLYTFEGLSCDKEHIALRILNTESEKLRLVRLHSECLTGDVFSSSRCDCGEQLNEAIARMSDIGGIILYLRQEGRGIGLYPKVDAYKLQDKGHDTFSANSILGYSHDLRDYRVAAEMLKVLGAVHINLLTNNPEKVEKLIEFGVEVESVTNTRAYKKEDNMKYLKDLSLIHI